MHRPQRWLGLAIAGYALLLGWVSCRTHEALETGIFDLGIHTQALWLLGQGLPDELTTRGLTLMSDHFTPILNLMAPLYALAGSPQALLLFQSAFSATGAWPLYRLCGGGRNGLLFALLYLLHPALSAANLFDFHASTLVAPLLLWCLWALHEGRLRWYFVGLVLIACCGEAMAISVAALSWEAWRLDRRRTAAATFLLGGLFSVVAVQCMLDANAGRPTQYRSLYAGPWLPRLFSPDAFVYLVLLFAPMAGLPLLGWERLVPAVPVILGNLLTWRSSQTTMEYHYDAAILPFLIWATELGWRKTGRRVPLLLALPVLLGLTVGLKFSRWHIAVTYRPSAATAAALASVDPDASVSADNYVGAHLSHRPSLFLFPNPFQMFCWGNRTGALAEGQYVTGHPPLPGELRRAVQESGVEQVVLDDEPGDIWPLHAEDRAYLFSELERLPYYRLAQHGGRLRVFQRQGGSSGAMPWIEAHPTLSPDGRRVAWESAEPTGLMLRRSRAGPFEHTAIWISDLSTGVARQVTGNGASSHPRWSSDGQHLVFLSEASDLVAGDDNAATDVFVSDHNGTVVGRYEAPGRVGRKGCHQPVLAGTAPIYLADGRVDLRRREIIGLQASTPGSAFGPVALAPDGSSWAAAALDTHGQPYLLGVQGEPGCMPQLGPNRMLIYAALEHGKWQLIRTEVSGRERVALTRGDDDSFEPALSLDGHWLAFSSYATNLTPGDRPGSCDVYLLDLRTGQLNCLTTGADGNSFHPSISADGSVVAFATTARNLLPDGNSQGRVLIWSQGRLRAASGPQR